MVEANRMCKDLLQKLLAEELVMGVERGRQTLHLLGDGLPTSLAK